MYVTKELYTLMVLAIIIVALLYSSLVEYCLHRFLLHHSYEQEHIKIHHKIFHGISSYELEEIDKTTVLSSAGEILRNVVLYSPAAAAVFINNKALGILFLAVCMLYNAWEELLHFYFHKKSDMFLEKLKIFQALKEHHRVHHYMYQYNFGIGSDFWDFIFRTKKRV